MARKKGKKKNEYIDGDIDHNVKVALSKLREAYWSNDYEKYAQQFVEAEKIIISTLVFGGFDIVRGWKPVTEGLPKELEVVLITNEKGNVGYGQFRGTGRDCHRWYWKGNTTEKVLAWMPKPKPFEVIEE